jgi:TPR repeat protein
MRMMRARILFAIFILLSALAGAQSMSPDALYERGIDAITGVGESHNAQLGVDCFRRSADLGYGPAQIALGYYYETGIVAPPNQENAGQLSLDLYKKAAQQSDSLAAWLAGRRYFLGNGVPQDLAAAQKWLKLAADQNSAYGSYYYGRLMADRDPAKAAALYKVAADQGLPQAQYFYGKALKEGKGVPKDSFNAFVWLFVASDAGYLPAGASLNELRADHSLTVDEASQGESKARDMEQVVIRAVNARGCSGWEGEFAEFPTPPPPSLQRFCR